MFSDIERSPSWQSPAFSSAPPPAHLAADFQQSPSLQPQPPYASLSSSSTAVRPPVQSGWFPLQDSGAGDPARNGHDMYSDSMLPPPAHRHAMQHPQQHHHQQHHQQQPPWAAAPDASTYVGAPDSRHTQAAYPGRPHPSDPTAYSPMYAPGYGTPVQDVGPGFGWQDARPMATPPIHTTGLEHLRGVSMASPYDDMQRVHAAAQGMHAMMGMGSAPARYPAMGGYPSPQRKKNHKEISIGRWTSEEHRVFVKGLEMYQGPAWGEIARMIGTRTSTQVRTHAQKFFTKLARTNQMLPHFESQIQKERARLISQGAVLSSQSSVTPTSTTAHSYTFSTLSPPRKREYPGQRMPGGPGYDDLTHTLRPPMATSMPGTYPGGDQLSPLDMYKPRLDSSPTELAGIRKPRLSSLEHAGLTREQQPGTPYGDHSPQMMAYNPTGDAYREPVGGYPNVNGDWNDVASRQWGPPPQTLDMSGDPTHSSDPDSLPSVTRLLYRGPPSA